MDLMQLLGNGGPLNTGNLDTLRGLFGGTTGLTGDPRLGGVVMGGGLVPNQSQGRLTSMDLIGSGLRPSSGGSSAGGGMVGVNPSFGPLLSSASPNISTMDPVGSNPVGGSSMGSNLVPSVAGDQEKTLDWLFTGGATGKGGGPVGQTLFSLAQGQLPQSMQDWITADANENFGHVGARFGTDLGGQITRNLGLAGSQQALSAMHELFGLGGTTAGFQFQRSENALDRALKEWQTSQQTDMSSQILMALLGGG